MKLRVVAVGGLKLRAERELCDEYLGRLRRYCAVEEIELKQSPAKIPAAFAKAFDGATVVAMDVGGRSMSSHELARRVESLASRGKGVVAFAIGAADGLPREVLDVAHERWSLSALTFPHRLARIVLAEQLYRAMTILRNEPYSH